MSAFESHAPFKSHDGERGAWKAADVGARAGFETRLSPAHAAALADALASVRRRGLALDEIGAADFPLGAFAAEAARLKREFLFGRGLVVLAGLPIAGLPESDIAAVFWGLASHFGRAVSQSVMGDRLGRVEDVSDVDPHARAYRAKRELELHTDLADAVCFCCIRQGASGGVSRYASALAVHDEMARAAPGHLATLYRGFRWHRFGEEGPGEAAVTPHRVPMFSNAGGLVSCRYVRAYIREGAAALGESLSASETAALDLFDRTAARPEFRVEFLLAPGDMVFVNNLTVLHARSRFENPAGPAVRRLLMRLWLATPEGRASVPEILVYPTGAGGGVPPQPGRVPSFVQKTARY